MLYISLLRLESWQMKIFKVDLFHEKVQTWTMEGTELVNYNVGFSVDGLWNGQWTGLETGFHINSSRMWLENGQEVHIFPLSKA